MLRVRARGWKVAHVCGHNSVPHNMEVDRLAKEGAKLSKVHTTGRRKQHKQEERIGATSDRQQ